MCSSRRSVDALFPWETQKVDGIVTLQGDQIASLYDLLSFQDKPIEGLAGRDNTRKPSGSVRTW